MKQSKQVKHLSCQNLSIKCFETILIYNISLFIFNPIIYWYNFLTLIFKTHPRIHNVIIMQVINSDRSYNQNAFIKVIQQIQIPKDSKNYFVISIIGTQSSGKSTLLNHLFGTRFKVLTGVSGTQTTSGVWLSTDREKPFVIIDCEGNDSIERASEDDFNFEKSVSIYALSLSNLLIVNVWTSQVGTYDGCQYGIITMLMQMSIKIFKQQSPKTLLFCLRDFDPDVDNLPNMQKIIITDIKKMWNSIQKPQKYSKHTYDRFFTVKIHPLFKFKSNGHERFDEDITKLRNKMVEPKNQGYLFKYVQQKYNLPLKQLPIISKDIWQSILDNKDINVPGVKIQLSNIRCEESKDRVIRSFQQVIKSIDLNITRDTNFALVGKQLEKGFTSSVEEYLKETKYYDKKIGKQKQDQLRKLLIRLIQDLNQNLSRKLKELQIDNFKTVSIKDFSNKYTAESQLSTVSEKTLQQFQNKIKSLKFSFPSKSQLLISFQKQIKSISKQLQLQAFENHQHHQMALTTRLMDEQVIQLTNNIGMGFWLRSQERYKEISTNLIKEISRFYSWIYDRDISARMINIILKQLESHMKNIIRQRFDLSLLDKLTKQFDNIFLSSRDGVIGKILTFKKQQFEELFKSARQSTMATLKQLNNVPDFNGDRNTIQQLFPTQKYQAFLDQFEKIITNKYQKSMRKETEKKMNKVPIILWIILFIFSFGEIKLLFRLLRGAGGK